MTQLRFGLRANARQLWLLVLVTALVGAVAGLERTVLPLVGEDEFGLASSGAILTFVAAFGAAKAVANLLAGVLAEKAGRRRLLVGGWLLALPALPLLALADSWSWIVAANVFLGASQGLVWSMAIVIKVDLVGPVRRGLALGVNEAAGYGGVAVAAFATGALAASFAPRVVVWVGAAAVVAAGLATSLLVHDSGRHAAVEAGPAGREAGGAFRRTLREPVLRACAQAGFAGNLNDALAWGLVPLHLVANGASVAEVGVVAAVYPAVWGVGQLPAGWLSDVVGRKPLIVGGTAVQALALAALALGGGSFAPALAAAALLGAGTALAYPTLIAAVSDAVDPHGRPGAVGVYRFWRDVGLVAGALLAGAAADAIGASGAIALVAVLTAASAAWVAATPWPAAHRPRRYRPSSTAA